VERVAVIERPDNEFLILGVNINGYGREDGIEAYLPEGKSTESTLLPLGMLSQALSFAIQTNPGDGSAEGWFIKEENRFQLNLATQQAFISGQLYNLSQGDAEAHIDDIYVRAKLLEKWFGLTIDIDLNALLVDIQSDAPLPFLAQMDRQARADNMLTSFSYDSALKAEQAYLLPYKTITTPSLLVSQDLIAQTSPGSQRYQTVSTLQANMELLKFGADLNLAYNRDTGGENKISTARMTFQRRDPRRQLLGPIQTGKIAFGDINFPSTPLLLGGKQGSGIAISSDPELGFRFARVPSDFFLEGDAPVGWDAELYRNGSFIDFQTIGPDGQFRFDETDLIDGYNQFQIILYGPEGQKRTITRDVFRGPNMLRSGELVYDLAAGMPQRNFLPLADGRKNDKTLGTGGQVFYGFNNHLTAGASFYAGPDGQDKTHGATFSVSSAFLGLNTQLQAMVANEGRRAYEAGLRMRPMGLNVAATHTVYKSFDVNDQELKSQTSLSLSRNLGRFNVSVNAKNRIFRQREDDFVLENIISGDLFGAKITNSLTRTFAKSDSVDDFEGELSLATNLFGSRLRGTLSYDLDSDAQDTFRTLRLSALKKLSEKDNLRLNANYDFPSGVTATETRYTHQFDAVSMDINAGATSNQNYTFGIGFRVGLQPGVEHLYNMVEPNRSAQARLELRAYIDKNANDRFDADDKPLEGIEFLASRGNVSAGTNKEGIARMYGLVEMPTKISVNAGKIPSIYLVPKQKELDLIPRRGAEARIDFAFKQLGEIDGFVFGTKAPDSEAKEPLSNLPVRLINLNTGEETHETQTEYDGYYVFSALPLGTYKVITSLGWFEAGTPDTVSRTVTLTGEEPAALDQDLELPFTARPDDRLEPQQSAAPTRPKQTITSSGTAGIAVPPDAQADTFRIHIASYSNKSTAEKELEVLETHYPDLFASNMLDIIAFELRPGVVFYRIVGPPVTHSAAESACARILMASIPDGCRVLTY